MSARQADDCYLAALHKLGINRQMQNGPEVFDKVRLQAKADLVDYIERLYKPARPHSAME